MSPHYGLLVHHGSGIHGSKAYNELCGNGINSFLDTIKKIIKKKNTGTKFDI